VHGRCRLRARFLARNARVRAALERDEARLRRGGVVLDEDRIAGFYLERIPEGIHSLKAFERWLRESGPDNDGLLQFSREDVIAPGAMVPDPRDLPETLELAGHALPVRYRFEPGAVDDGATVELPLAFLPQLSAGEAEWGIPGWRAERLTEAIRGLPKATRRQLVPAPDVAARCLAGISPRDGAFLEAAATWLTRHGGVPVAASELRASRVPERLKLNFRVSGDDGRTVGEGRDVDELKRSLRKAQDRALAASAEDFVREGIADWDFGTLPETMEVVRGGLRLLMYPSIEDRGSSVSLTCLDSPERAAIVTRAGVRRLLALRLEPQLRYVRKALAADRELALLLQPVGPLKDLADDACDRAVERCCLPEGEPLPRNRAGFEDAAERGRPDLYEEAMRILRVVREALSARRDVLRALEGLPEGVDPALVEDCRQQAGELAGLHLVAQARDPWLDSLPRFLKAALRRAEKLRVARGPALDTQYELREWRATVSGLQAGCRAANTTPPQALERLRWMVEEYGVSLFAQELRTSLPVSAKRLRQQLDAARAALSA